MTQSKDLLKLNSDSPLFFLTVIFSAFAAADRINLLNYNIKRNLIN